VKGKLFDVIYFRMRNYTKCARTFPRGRLAVAEIHILLSNILIACDLARRMD